MSFLHRHRWLTPYLLGAGDRLPGPLLRRPALLPRVHVAAGGDGPGRLHVHLGLGQLLEAFSTYQEQFFRSLQYAGIATVARAAHLLPAHVLDRLPGGRWKNLLLLFIIAPFFVTYLIRTLAWQNILADDGFVVGVMQFGLVADDGRVLATSTA